MKLETQAMCKWVIRSGFWIAILWYLGATSAQAQIPRSSTRILTLDDFNCQSTTRGLVFEQFTWDGWHGELTLWADNNCSSQNPSARCTGKLFFPPSGEQFDVRYTAARDPHEVIEGMRAPGMTSTDGKIFLKNRIVLWIDFNQTFGDPSDDTRFDGYMANTNASFSHHLTGVTWWRGIPFGFFTSFNNGSLYCQ